MQSEYKHIMTLRTHEHYPVYVPSRPLSLKNAENISIAIEDSCGTSQRHFVGRSYDKVKDMVKHEKWKNLFDYCYHAIFDILRELYRDNNIHSDFLIADPIVFLEHGITKGIISFPEYAEVINVQRSAEKLIEKTSHDYNHSTSQLPKTNVEKYDYSMT